MPIEREMAILLKKHPRDGALCDRKRDPKQSPVFRRNRANVMCYSWFIKLEAPHHAARRSELLKIDLALKLDAERLARI
jgi:hypothetical protein